MRIFIVSVAGSDAPYIYKVYDFLASQSSARRKQGEFLKKNVCEHNRNIDVSQNNVKKVIKNAENVVRVRKQSYLCIVKKIKTTQRCVEKDD